MRKIILILLCNCVVQFSQSQIPTYVPTDSLVGWWPFDGDVKDYSGNNNHGTAVNLSEDIDRYGNNNKCYSFDGTSSFITIPNNPNLRLTKNWSIAAWIYTKGFNGFSNYQTIFSKRNDKGVWAYSLSLSFAGNVSEINRLVSARRDDNLNIELLHCQDSFKSKLWFHVVASCKNDSLSYFMNGKQIGATQKFNLTVPDQNIEGVIGRICSCNSNHPEWFYGKLDDFAIWSRALDSTEIQNLYNSNSASLRKHNMDSQCKLSPNPVKNILTIQGLKPNSEFQITNSIGQTYMQGTFNSQLDLSKLNSGVYFFKTEMGIQRFIKE